MTEMWRTLGCHESTHLRVLTDGDRGMEPFVRRSTPGTTGRVLDRFHIAIRVPRTALLNAICPLVPRVQKGNSCPDGGEGGRMIPKA